MKTRALTLSLAMAVIVTAGFGQTPTFLAQGDIGAAGTNQIRTMPTLGGTTTGFGAPAAISTILWDPANPDDFICGTGTTSNSFTGGLIRASYAPTGSPVWTSIPMPLNSFRRPEQLSWNQAGTEIIVTTIGGTVHSVHPTTGVVTDIAAGVPAWGNVTVSGSMDPKSGDIWVGTTTGELWRISSGNGTASMVIGGFGPIRKVVFDEQGASSRLCFMTDNSFHRFVVGGTPVVETFFGELGQPTVNNLVSFSLDQNGDYVFVNTSRNISRLTNLPSVPPGGIAPTFVGVLVYPSTSNSYYTYDISVVGATPNPFKLVMQSFPGGGVNLDVENLPANTARGWILLSQATFLPRNTGPMFGIFPDGLTFDIIGLTPSPGFILAFTAGGPTPFYRANLFMIPWITQTWDGVCVVVDSAGNLAGISNVVRTTWQ